MQSTYDNLNLPESASYVILTKITPPFADAKLISRPRLLQQLDEGAKHKLTLLSAPAGYGKTSLLGDWVRQCKHPVAWFSLDAEDNEPVRWLSCLVGSMPILSTETKETLFQLLRAPQNASNERNLALILNVITNSLKTAQELILILDDYQFIQNQEIHQALAFLLEHSSPRLHFVISSRQELQLPFARLRAYEQTLELTANDLSFTHEEVLRFFQETDGTVLSSELAEELMHRSEGWITALKLLSRSFPNHLLAEGIKHLSGSQRYLFDYLTEEVLAQQPDETNRFLLQISVLKRFNASLCNSLTKRKDSQTILENQEKANLFLIPLDDERCWYRFHHLFSEFLQKQLAKHHPDLWHDLHQRACDSYRENGLFEEAIEQALLIPDFNQVMQLIEQTSEAMLMQNQATTLQSWLNELPREQVLNSKLSLPYAWCLASACRFEELEPWLAAAERQGCSQGEILAIRAYAASVAEDATLTIQLSRQAIELLPKDALFARSIVTFGLGLAYARSGNIIEASNTLQKSIALSEASGDLFTALTSLNLLLTTKMIEGKLKEAFEHGRYAIALSTKNRKQPLPVAGMINRGLGILMYEWNELEQGLTYLKEGLRLSKEWGNVEIIIECYGSQIRFLQATGDFEGITQCIENIDQLYRSHGLPYQERSINLNKIPYWQAVNNTEAIERWIKEVQPSLNDPIDNLHEVEHIHFARILISKGQAEEAMPFLSRLFAAAKTARREKKVLEIRNLQALAWDQKGDERQALALLEENLIKAEPEGFIRTFVDEGEGMRALLQKMLHQQSAHQDPTVSCEYLEKLLQAFPQSNQPGVSEGNLMLSRRELDILKLIATGASNLEISQELFITVGTVKTHVHNIYNKLGARSRTKAIIQAQKTGLL